MTQTTPTVRTAILRHPTLGAGFGASVERDGRWALTAWHQLRVAAIALALRALATRKAE